MSRWTNRRDGPPSAGVRLGWKRTGFGVHSSAKRGQWRIERFRGRSRFTSFKRTRDCSFSGSGNNSIQRPIVRGLGAAVEFLVESQISDTMKAKQVLLARRSPAYWRVTINHPPLNIFGPDTIPQLNQIITALETDEHVDALATRIASFDKRAVGETKRFVDVASLPPDYEIAPEWDVCLASIMRPAAQERIKMLMDRGFHRPGDVEDRLGYHVGQLRS